jgi:thiamine-phosphate pyrophosphorylase
VRLVAVDRRATVQRIPALGDRGRPKKPRQASGNQTQEIEMETMTILQQRRHRLQRARLYAIVDTGYVEPDRVAHVTEQLVLGGADLIQLRTKKLALPAIAELGKTMRVLIPASGPLFILNDHSEFVPETGADGIHVGQDDLSVAEARARAGAGALVGKSTHSLEQAIAAEREGADYIGVGPIFATPTKPDYVPVGPALIGPVRGQVRVPQFCIGGINEQTLHKVLAAGALRVVIVSALLQSRDIPAYCRRMREQVEAFPL